MNRQINEAEEYVEQTQYAFILLMYIERNTSAHFLVYKMDHRARISHFLLQTTPLLSSFIFPFTITLLTVVACMDLAAITIKF